LDKWDRFLLFFDRSVLSKYRASPDSYKLEEDDMGGRLENMETDQSRPISWYQVRFAFRRLANGEVSVAAFGPDIHKLPQREMLIWRGYLLENPVFVQEDTAFERWVSRYLKGSWQVESGPRYKIDRQIQLIRALTEQTLGQPLMRFDEHNLVNYPVAENTEAYAKAHLERWFPKFIGPPRPEFKLGEIMGAVGKTIESVKFGEEPTYPGKHQSEGIVIHSADGSAMAIMVGSNAMNLSSQFEGLNPEDVSTDLVVLWAPAIKK
jgi:hypothetical protein